MQHDQSEESRISVSPQVAVLAWTLILGGVFVATYVLQQLLTAYLDVDGNSFVGALAQRLSGSAIMTVGDLPLVLTEQGATIAAYFVFIPLALLGVHIAAALIRAGSHILSPTFPYQLSRLKQRISRLSAKINEND